MKAFLTIVAGLAAYVIISFLVASELRAADDFCDVKFRQRPPLVLPQGGKYDFRTGNPPRDRGAS